MLRPRPVDVWALTERNSRCEPASATLRAMDRSGAMPRSAWVEIRDQAGELLASIPARIEGGSVTAELPAFPPGTLGTIQMCTDEDGTIYRDPAELRELPTGPQLMLVEMG